MKLFKLQLNTIELYQFAIKVNHDL